MGSRVWSGPDTRRKLGAAQAPWGSMLNTPRRTPAPAPVSVPAASGQPFVINLSVGGHDFGQVLVDVGRKEVKTRGGLVATFGSL